MLARHAGASRFAYNQCLQLVADALRVKEAEPQVRVPWSGFDLIDAFNAWKRSETAGRVFVAAPDGTITKHVTGLVWRREVSAQVFGVWPARSVMPPGLSSPVSSPTRRRGSAPS
jgi:putative transposase